tara:strand:- start:790 stop:2625 length:1836 start_codon:yes stop_codon:yes gene_type:complete
MTTMISPHAQTVLGHRYFLKDAQNEPIEDSNMMFHRVADAVAKLEDEYYTLPIEREMVARDFYDMMADLKFLPNSPTLMNAGTEQGTLSACFVLPLEDSMEGIMQAATDTAMVQKFGGGTGFALSNIRPRGERIKTTHGIACGPIEVLKTLSRVSSMITQGGKRDGANMAVMSVYHPDILDFISCKSVEGDIHNFNISVGVDSNWMKLVEVGADYNLINPYNNTISGTLNAREVFNKIIDGAWRNGEPGMIFLDRVNADNHVIEEYGPMIATNPCGEQPLLPNESCNLGSINLSKFYVKDDTDGHGHIAYDELARVTKLAVNFLDNVIDANKYATPDIEKMTKATRKIGLGVMGFADLLIQLGIPYNSQKARDIGRDVMSAIRDAADEASLELGAMRGPFPAWERSSYDKETEAYRNNCRLTVAPTGTISMIADCSSGIEPTFALAWEKQNILEGKTLVYTNKYFEAQAKERGFYSEDLMGYLAQGGSLQEREEIPEDIKAVFITSPEISPDSHVKMQAVFQRQVDSGISKTINMPNKASIEDVMGTYKLAWLEGCKGITVYRAGSRDKEVLVKGTKIAVESDQCCDNPQMVYESGCHKCLSCDWSACEIA